MSALPAATRTRRDREEGVIGVRLSRARRLYWCDNGTARFCKYTIHPGEHYWRYYGRMAEAFDPFTARECEVCHQQRQETVP